MNTSEAYRHVLQDILEHGEVVSPRGKPTRELLNYVFNVAQPSSSPIMTSSKPRNLVIAKYTKAEFKLYADGESRASEFAKHAPMWASIANPDGTINSNYGRLLFELPSCGKTAFAKHGPITPWEWAKNSLMRDKDTRQAYLRFSLPKHQWFGNKDQVCTMHGQFLIRLNRLHLTIVMRSNDAVRGLVYDMPWFCYLMERMQCELRMHYPELQLGRYAHIAHSMHVYESDIPLVKEMVHGTV